MWTGEIDTPDLGEGFPGPKEEQPHGTIFPTLGQIGRLRGNGSSFSWRTEWKDLEVQHL
jgi:hypothetical protein